MKDHKKQLEENLQAFVISLYEMQEYWKNQQKNLAAMQMQIDQIKISAKHIGGEALENNIQELQTMFTTWEDYSRKIELMIQECMRVKMQLYAL